MTEKIKLFTGGFIVGILISVAIALTCVKTYTYLSYGEGLGKLKSIGRQFRK